MKLAHSTRIKIILVGSFVVALAIALISIWQMPETAAVRINGYTVTRVRHRMTRKEVEAIFRVPAGEYSSRIDPLNSEKPTSPWGNPILKWDSWGGNDAVVFVHFGPDGRVDASEAHIRNTRKPPWPDDWLARIKYKWLGW